MEYRRLGRTGLKLSEIGLGGWLTFGDSVGESDADRIIRRAFDLGINFYDTANVYATGESERIMGQALSQFPREGIILATKVRGRMWPGPLGEGLSRKHIISAVDHSLIKGNITSWSARRTSVEVPHSTIPCATR